ALASSLPGNLWVNVGPVTGSSFTLTAKTGGKDTNNYSAKFSVTHTLKPDRWTEDSGGGFGLDASDFSGGNNAVPESGSTSITINGTTTTTTWGAGWTS